MKKLLCLLTAGSLALSLCGCNLIRKYLRDNIGDQAANSFDEVMNHGSQLLNAVNGELKKQLKGKLDDVSDEVREAVEDEIEEALELDKDAAIFTTIPHPDGGEVAILANFPEARLAVTLTEFPIGTKFPDPPGESSATFTLIIDGKEIKMDSMQCQAYARYIQEKLYGDHDLRDDGNENFTNILPEAIGSKTVAPGKLTADTLKKAVTAAGAGAHLRTQGKQHSMFIVEVTETGFIVLQANGDGQMSIEKTQYTWQEYADSTFGKRGLSFITVYRPVD